MAFPLGLRGSAKCGPDASSAHANVKLHNPTALEAANLVFNFSKAFDARLELSQEFSILLPHKRKIGGLNHLNPERRLIVDRRLLLFFITRYAFTNNLSWAIHG